MKAHNLQVTGSLTTGGEAIGSISSSVATTTLGLGSRLTTIEGKSLVSGSGQIPSLLPSGVVSGSAQTISNLPSGVVSGSAQTISNLPSGTVSGSAQVDVMSTTNISRLATTGSNTFQGLQTVNGSLVVTGSLTAQQFIVSSSVTYLTESFASGSHKFGDSSDDYHDFTGSVRINGTLVSTSTTLISGSAQVDIMSTTNIARLATTGSNTFSGLIAIGGTNDGAGTLYVTASANTNAARLRNNDASYGTLDVLNSNASGIGIYAVANKHFISGSLGINTTSPGDVIDVRKNQNATTNFYFRNTDTTNASSRAYLNVVAGDTTMSMLALHGGDTYLAGTLNRNMYFQQNPGGTVNMFISGSGNIGIGNTNPSAKLDIYAGSSTSGVLWGQTIRNEGNGAATNYGAGLKFKVSSDGTPNEIYKWAGIAGVAGTNYSNRTDLAFYTAASSTADATEKVRIDGNGIMGINTTAPGLQTNGIGLVISSNTTQFPVLRLERLTGGGGGKTVTNWEWVINSSGGLTLQNQSDAYEPFIMENITGTATLSGDLYANKSTNVARYTRVNGLYEYVKDGPYTSSNTTVSVIRQFHDAANWCNGGILVEITCHGYATSEYDHAIYFVRYGYNLNSTAIDTRMSPITNRITAPYWGSAINISGNDYYRDLFFDTQAYRSYKIVLKTIMAPTTNSTGAGQGNYVYLFGY